MPAPAALPGGRFPALAVTGLIAVRELFLSEGETEILSMNCTGPEVEVLVVVELAYCLELPGLTVLQLASRKKATIKRVVFNILSTSGGYWHGQI